MRRLLLFNLIITLKLVFADEQLVAQYVLNSMNANNQTQLLVENINNLNVTKVSINYYGNSFYIANEVRNAISQSYNQISVEMNSLNSYMTYSTAQAIVNLFSDQQSIDQKQDKSAGNFFDYDSEPNGFFNYGN